MRKIISLIIAFILCFITITLNDKINNQKLNETHKKNKSNYTYKFSEELRSKAMVNNTIERNQDIEFLNELVDDNTAIVLGSSELSSRDEIAFPSYLFSGVKSDFKVLLMGMGYHQSIHQAMTLGAISDVIDNKKVVLILSPQWFVPGGLRSEAYASRFTEENFIRMLENKKLSKKTKIALAEKIVDLLEKDPQEQSLAKKYYEMYLGDGVDSATEIELKADRNLKKNKNRETFLTDLNNTNLLNGALHRYREFVFEKKLSEAEQLAASESTNNPYGIYDDYYSTYIEYRYNDLRNSETYGSYLDSPEYDDFKLFIKTCKELKIEPLIVSVPLNGRWADYTGFPKAERDAYYSKIREICSSEKIKLIDFSDKEYELYFLKDIMHMGKKGWVYFDQAIIDFYKNKNTKK